MTIAEFQEKIRDIYFERDSARGTGGTFMWFIEEVGELSRAIMRGDAAEMREEFSDALAWLVSLASLCEVDIEQAAGKYSAGCPKCGGTPCGC